MDQLAFGILGPLEARYGERHILLSRPRERVLLAALLVDHGRVVSVDRLIQALWGERPPETARRQVAIAVSHLRAAFAAGGAAAKAVTTCAPGYVVTGARLDVRRFEEYAALAHAARAAGELPTAAGLLSSALALWRGPALDGIDRPFAEAEAARLEERRITVTGERIDLELELGRHEEMIGELLALVAADPLRERTRAQLMLALYGAGRRAEALEAYRSARRLLAESLGIEPGPGLQQLHQAVLRDDPGLAPAAWAPRIQARPVVAVPAQLPPDVAAFTGRAAELVALDQLAVAAERASRSGVSRPLPIGVISGMAGVGKTGLTVHWAHGAAHRFPGGQLFADLRGYGGQGQPLPPGAVLEEFLRALGVPGQQIPAGPDERTALFRTLLNGRRVLVVLDNARTPEQIRPLLPGSGTCMVLITSRNPLEGLVGHDGAKTCRLGVLSREEAAELLRRLCPGDLTGPVIAERIGSLCGRLPLALRLAAARLTARPYQTVSVLAERLADEHRRLPELSGGDRGVRISFGFSYRELPDKAAELLRRLGLLQATDFAAWVAAALMGATGQEAEDLLDQLVQASLLEPAGTDGAGQARYRLHDLVRLFAREHSLTSDSPQVRREAVGRLLGAALHLAEEADAALGNPFVIPLYGGSPRHRLEEDTLRRVLRHPLAWFEAERTCLTGAVTQARKLGLAGYAWELTCALSQFLSTRGHLDDWQACAGQAAAAARAAGHERGEAAMLLQLADLHGGAGRCEEAARITSRALALANRSGDNEAIAACRTVMAVLHLLGGNAALAQQDAEHALGLLGSPRSRSARGRALTVLGLSHLDQGRPAAAADCFTRFLRIQQRSHSVRGQAEARYRLGTARLQQGCYADAVRMLTAALRTATDAGDLMTAMPARIRLGQAFLELGQLEEARPLLEYAVRGLSDGDAPHLRAMALDGLGRLHRAQDEPGQALPLMAEAKLLRRTLSRAWRATLQDAGAGRLPCV